MPPQVSIVIPLYNAASWIAETLASVIGQSFDHNNIEIIIVDDGSIDNSINIAEQVLQSSKITYCISQISNSGPSIARNIGWQQSRGEWIQFLDADDLLDTEKISTQTIQAALPPEIAVVYSNWQHIAQIDGTWQLVNMPLIPRIGSLALEDLLKTENFIATGSQLFRRTWLEQVGGFDERYWLIEDVDLLLRIAMAGGNFHYCPSEEPLFFYRQHATSLSRSDPHAFVVGCVRNAQMVEVYWRDHNQLTSKRAELIAAIYSQGARYFAGVDWRTFESLIRQIENLVPGFLPNHPLVLRRLSQLIGYRKAEHIAVIYRGIKQHMMGT